MLPGRLIIMRGHRTEAFRATQKVSDRLNMSPGEFAIHGYQVQIERLDIPDKRVVTIDQQGFPKIDRFQQGIAKPFR